MIYIRALRHFSVLQGEGSASLIDCVTLAKDLAVGLRNMHKLGYIHGDVKAHNSLFRRNKRTGEIMGSVADFGFTFNQETEPANFAYQKGHYGTKIFTAPELLGVKNFTGDYEATDAFAFGMMLYELCNEERPPWVTF